jgi:hypothetical protein
MLPIASDDEILFRGEVGPGDNSIQAKRVQEWLTLHDFALPIDGTKKGGGYGRITSARVKDFQAARGLDVTGVVNEATWNELVHPMQYALTGVATRVEGLPLDQVFAGLLRFFLRLRPREVGGDNMGPWVRLFMRGREGVLPSGERMAWCAGFVSTLLELACRLVGIENPIGYHDDCTALARAGQKAGWFVQGEKVPDHAVGVGLVEKEERSDNNERYAHTYGFTDVEDGIATTIEGNFGAGLKAGVHAYKRNMQKNDALLVPALRAAA